MLHYPKLPGEFGVLSEGEPYGHMERFGILPQNVPYVPYLDGENLGYMFNQRACSNLPGARGSFSGGRIPGHSTGIWEAYTGIHAEVGTERLGIVHHIAGGAGATATGTMGSGSIVTATVVTPGGPYFVPPKIRYRSASGSLILNRASLQPVMAATVVKVVDSLPGFTNGQLVPVQNGIVLQVATTDISGHITAATIATPGAMADPTVGTYCNRYYAGHDPMNATAWFFIGFGLSGINILEGGVGGTGTVALYVDPPTVPGIVETGHQVLWGRLGVQGAPDIHLGHMIAKSDVAPFLINADHQAQAGAHVDYLSSGLIESYVCENTGQTGAADKNGWAAFSCDGNAYLQTRRMTVNYLEVQRAAFHAAAISSDCRIDHLVVDGWGELDTNTAVGYFGPATQQACALLGFRGTPDIGKTEIRWNTDRMGATAAYDINIMSTGLSAANQSGGVPDDSDPDSQTNDFTALPARLGPVTIRNQCRGGAQFVDPTYPDSNPCIVSTGDIVIEYSTVVPMWPGFLTRTKPDGTTAALSRFGLNVNPHAAGREVRVSLGEIRPVNCNGTGVLNPDNSYTGIAPNHLCIGAGTQVSWSVLRDSLHSNGILVLEEGQGRGRVRARSAANMGMPYGGSLPLVWRNNPADGSDIHLDADSQDLHQQRPVIWMITPGACEVWAEGRNYRNCVLGVLDTPSKTVIRRYLAVGLGGSETGLLLKGAQAGVGYTNLDISNCAKGVDVAAGVTFDAACYAIGANCHGNPAAPPPANTTIPAGSIPAQLAAGSFSP